MPKYIKCLNCQAENEKKESSLKKYYCWNCGCEYNKPPSATKPLKIDSDTYSINTKTNELLIDWKSIFRIWPPPEHRRIPLSEIEAVRVYVISHSVSRGDATDLLVKKVNDEYHCDISRNNKWREFAERTKGRLLSKPHDVEPNILRLAAMIGLHREDKQKKLQELADSLPGLAWSALKVADNTLSNSEIHRKLSRGIDFKCAIADIKNAEADSAPALEKLLTGSMHDSCKKTGVIKNMRVDSSIYLQDSVIDSVDVLRTNDINGHYVLAYTINGKTTDSIWTNRLKKFLAVGWVTKVEWGGGPLARYINRDIKLQELLLSHLQYCGYDAYITTDKLQGNTMVIFGDAFPRQWIKYPKGLSPSAERIRIVKMLAKHIRSS